MMFLDNLSDLLYKNKMTRSDLARAIGIAPSTVNSWYNRSCENVSLRTLTQIANYFNVSLDELVNGSKPKETALTDREIEQLKRIIAYYEKINGELKKNG